MLFYPNKYVNKIEEITIELLQKNKIKALILDVDNTLVNYNFLWYTSCCPIYSSISANIPAVRELLTPVPVDFI